MNPADSDTIIRNLTAARRFAEGVLGGADPDAFAELVAESVVVDTGLKPAGRSPAATNTAAYWLQRWGPLSATGGWKSRTSPPSSTAG